MAPSTIADRTRSSRSPVRRPASPLAGTRNKANSSMKKSDKPDRAADKSCSRDHTSTDENLATVDRNSDASGLSFAEQAGQLARTATPVLVKGDGIMRDIVRAPPGDPPQLRTRKRSLLGLNGTSGGGPGLAKKRSQFFEDAFSARDGNSSPAKDRVRNEALILAEVRTNVIICDELMVITELSAHLALRYRRPLSSIVVTLQHNSCMCFGGSFEPCYIMAVYALPSELQPTTNKRNAALIQKHMEEIIGVNPARGFLRFAPVPEANLAYDGKTTAGHVDDVAKHAHAQSPDSTNEYRLPTPVNTADAASVGSSRSRKAPQKLTVKTFSSFRSPSPSESTGSTTSTAYDDQQSTPSSSALPAIPERSLKGSPQQPSSRDEPQPEVQDYGEQRRDERRARNELREGKSPTVMNETVPARPETVLSVDSQASRRVRRTKSFVASLFRLSGGRHDPMPA